MHWTLRWLLIAILNRIFPPEKLSEEALIAYGREEATKPPPLVQPHPPIVELPQTLQWPTLAWTRYYLDTHPHLRRQTGPLRKIDLVPEPTTDPINRLDTQPIVEETQKYRVPPRFLRE